MSVITFGEIMLRLTPPEYHTIENASSFQANYGGGEANVAISLARFGHQAYFVSRLPDNQLGDSAIRYLKGYDVNTQYVDRGGTNIGIYFLEVGFGGRNSKVLYNRKYAAITSIKEDYFDFDEIFKEAKWFHFSGITLALGDKVRNVLYKMLEYAHKHNVTVSFDCNYRKTLWSVEEAKEHYLKVLPYVDVLFASKFDAVKLFDVKVSSDDLDEVDEHEVFKQLIDKSKVAKIFGTKRKIYTATDNELSAYCYTKDKCFTTEPTRFNIYDRIGGGDAFAAGIINCMIKYPNDIDYTLEFGLATSVLKHTLWGDAFMLSERDVKNYMKNNIASVNR